MKARDMACLLLVVLSLLCMALLLSCSRTASSVPIGEQELPDMELRDADGRVVEERHLTLEDAEPILRTGRYRYTVDAASRFPTEMLVNE